MLPECLELRGFLQEYAWGMGPGCRVHHLGSREGKTGKYAELWFGAHPSGTAEVLNYDLGLQDILSQFARELLGARVLREYGPSLPFLFKVLSVGTALSIQAHPDEELAKVLHEKDPEHYRDPFPKPEVGIALTPVDLLYGFRPRTEVLAFLSEGALFVDEFAVLVEPDIVAKLQDQTESYSNLLRRLYARVMTCSQAMIEEQCRIMFARLSNKSELSAEERWILDLSKSYPQGDAGLFSFFMLNLVQVPIGKALYIGPNIPHAYLRNELAECMAPSDNVVRAGLTPKFVDRTTLLEMLSYSTTPPELLEPLASQNEGFQKFPVPLKKYFSLSVLYDKAEGLVVEKNDEVEMLVCTEGVGELKTEKGVYSLKPGVGLLVTAGCQSYSLSTEGAQIFRISVA